METRQERISNKKKAKNYSSVLNYKGEGGGSNCIFWNILPPIAFNNDLPDYENSS